MDDRPLCYVCDERHVYYAGESCTSCCIENLKDADLSEIISEYHDFSDDLNYYRDRLKKCRDPEELENYTAIIDEKQERVEAVRKLIESARKKT